MSETVITIARMDAIARLDALRERRAQRAPDTVLGPYARGWRIRARNLEVAAIAKRGTSL